MHVIMKKQRSPIFITEASPHVIIANKVKGSKLVTELNKKATTNEYWLVKVKVIEE